MAYSPVPALSANARIMTAKVRVCCGDAKAGDQRVMVELWAACSSKDDLEIERSPVS